MTDVAYVSLAQLAAMNTDDVATLTSRNPPAGIYHVKCYSVGGKESEPREDGQAPLIRFGYGYEVLMAKPVKKEIDPDSMVGRKFNESYTLWPSDFLGMIGLLKGRYEKVGLPNQGIMGGLEGADPGWIDGALEAEFDIQVRLGIKDGEERAYFDWLKPDPKRWEASTDAAAQEQNEVVAG